MACQCSQYQPIELSRKSVHKRIRESKEIMPTLVLLAEKAEEDLKLLKCPDCGQYWQSNREWGFRYKEYVFQVPEIEVAEWLSQPYIQPAALMLYSAMMETYFERTTFEESSNECRVKGCKEKALKLSACCRQHHIEQLQRADLLPEFPTGKLFPPYLK